MHIMRDRCLVLDRHRLKILFFYFLLFEKEVIVNRKLMDKIFAALLCCRHDIDDEIHINEKIFLPSKFCIFIFFFLKLSYAQ